MPEWIVRVAEWSVLLPLWRRVTETAWIRIAASSVVGLLWLFILFSIVSSGSSAGSYDRCKGEVGSLNESSYGIGADPVALCSALFNAYDKNGDGALGEVECDTMNSKKYRDLISSGAGYSMDDLVFIALVAEFTCS